MKEININIEGYNVNGICVGCLNYKRKMFYKDEIKECYKLLADIDVSDGLAIQLCWECLAAVNTIVRFKEQIQQSYDILIAYSQEHTFLNSPKDLSVYAHDRFTVTNIPNVDILDPPVQCDDEDIKENIQEVKSEVDEDEKYNFNLTETGTVKVEFDNADDNTQFEDYPSQEQDETSDEDIQLSKLKSIKERKSKKEKKLRSKNRVSEIKVEETRISSKLKNLPEDLVELHTMNEEEMWRVRGEDQGCKEFSKLKYKCSDCVISFNSEKLMNDHMRGKHWPKSDDCAQCDVCKSYILTKENLSTHRALHLNAFRCKECGICTGMKRLMLRHVRVHRGPEGEHHGCPTCGKVFNSKSKLSYHKNVCHQDKPQCDCCGKVFANKMTLKYHLKILPQNKDDKPKEKLYLPCKGCNKVFSSKKSYRAHVVIHNGVTYPCPVCGKLFQWKRNLARHARNHRERDAGALHECRECGKTFSSRDCYNNHMRLSKRHVPEDAYGHQCNYCGKKFATKWCMVDHIDWDHLKRIKYQCSVCFKPFKTAKIMVAHMNNIHEGKKSREPEGEHLCEICGKSYKTVKRLKGHVWAMHTNRSTSKSFKCKLCPATFTWQTSIYKHIKMMHDTSKRGKQSRLPPVKKQEPYSDIELSHRVQYFQQNMQIVPPVQSLV